MIELTAEQICDGWRLHDGAPDMPKGAQEAMFRCGEVISALNVGTWGKYNDPMYEVAAYRILHHAKPELTPDGWFVGNDFPDDKLLDLEWRSGVRLLSGAHGRNVSGREGVTAWRFHKQEEAAKAEEPKPAMHCMCAACSGGVLHSSDCAVHGMDTANGIVKGPCDCGVISNPAMLARDEAGARESRRLATAREQSRVAAFFAHNAGKPAGSNLLVVAPISASGRSYWRAE